MSHRQNDLPHSLIKQPVGKEWRTKKYNAADRATKVDRLKVPRKSNIFEIQNGRMADLTKSHGVASSRLNHRLGILKIGRFNNWKIGGITKPYLPGSRIFPGTNLLLSFGS